MAGDLMLKIVPNGVIKNGFIEIAYVPELQTLRVLGMAKIGISIFTKTFSFDETRSIPKELMKSSNFVMVAKKTIDNTELEVVNYLPLKGKACGFEMRMD